MDTFDVQIGKIHPLMQGTSKARKSWQMVKIEARVVTGLKHLIGKKVYLILWNEKAVSLPQTFKLEMGEYFSVEGEYKKSEWTSSSGKKHLEEQVIVKNFRKISAPLKAQYISHPHILNELKSYVISPKDSPLHHILSEKSSSLLLSSYLTHHPEKVNELNSTGWHALFGSIFKKEHYDFAAMLKCPGINLDVKSPGGFSLWDFIIEQKDTAKARLFYDYRPEGIVYWGEEQNKRLLSLPLGKMLLKEKLVLPSKFELAGLDSCSTIEELVNHYHPQLGRHGMKLVLEKIRTDKIFVENYLLIFLKIAFDSKFDINHLHKILSHFSSFKTLVYLADLEAILVKNEVKLEQFYLNLMEDKNLVDEKKSNQLVKDLLSMVKELLVKNVELADILFPDKVNNLTRLHDSIAAFHRNYLRFGPNQKMDLIKFFPKLKNLNLEFGEAKHRLVIPTDTHTLCNWGFWMNNCVASYTHECQAGRTLVLGVEDQEGKMFANIEIRQGQLRQLYGKGNSRLKQSEHQLIEKFLKDSGLLTPAPKAKTKTQTERRDNLFNMFFADND